MANILYLDFDLQIERGAQGYQVEVDGPAGQAVGSFSLPFSELELENFLLKMGVFAGPPKKVHYTQSDRA